MLVSLDSSKVPDDQPIPTKLVALNLKAADLQLSGSPSIPAGGYVESVYINSISRQQFSYQFGLSASTTCDVLTYGDIGDYPINVALTIDNYAAATQFPNITTAPKTFLSNRIKFRIKNNGASAVTLTGAGVIIR